MNQKKLFLVWILAAVLAVFPVLASAESAAEDALAYLGRELDAAAEGLIRRGEDIDDVYTEISWQSMADTFPEKFDLRERGTVTPVKNQSPWSTCWSFADIAASETSILNTLGMTAEEYREKYGEDMDLSEKHLAWFTAAALPESGEGAEGAVPFNAAQAGEGLHPMEDSEKNPMNFGGNNILALTVLANGCGIVTEQLVPYAAADGSLEVEGDWSLPEIMRYAVSIELKDANLLPSPAKVDAEENYTYRAAGTEAIKSELMAGRAAAVSIRADVSAPGQTGTLTPAEKQAQMKAYLADREGASEEEKARFAEIWSGAVPLSAVTEDELREILKKELAGRPEGFVEDGKLVPRPGKLHAMLDNAADSCC